MTLLKKYFIASHSKRLALEKNVRGKELVRVEAGEIASLYSNA